MEDTLIKKDHKSDILHFHFNELTTEKDDKIVKSSIETAYGEFRKLSEGQFLGRCRKFVRLGNASDAKHLKIDCFPIAEITVNHEHRRYYILVWLKGCLSVGERAIHINDIRNDWVAILKRSGSEYYCTDVKKF